MSTQRPTLVREPMTFKGVRSNSQTSLLQSIENLKELHSAEQKVSSLPIIVHQAKKMNLKRAWKKMIAPHKQRKPTLDIIDSLPPLPSPKQTNVMHQTNFSTFDSDETYIDSDEKMAHLEITESCNCNCNSVLSNSVVISMNTPLSPLSATQQSNVSILSPTDDSCHDFSPDLSDNVNVVKSMKIGSQMICFSKHTTDQWQHCCLSDDKRCILWDKMSLFSLSDVWSVKSCPDKAIQHLLRLYNIPSMKANGLKSLAFTVEFRDFSFFTFVADSYKNACLWFRGIQALSNENRKNEDENIMVKSSYYLRVGNLSIFDFISNPYNNNAYFMAQIEIDFPKIEAQMESINDFISKFCITGSEMDISMLTQSKQIMNQLKVISIHCYEIDNFSESEMISFRELWGCVITDWTALLLKINEIQNNISQ